MKRISRVATTLSVSIALAAAGGAVAQAYAWGTLTVKDGSVVQGHGYGNFYLPSSTKAVLQSWLRDVNSGHGRTYAQADGYGGVPNFSIQSGRRADGEDWYARMADKSFTSSSSLTNFSGRVKICQDITLQNDPCSIWDYGSL
jgi:hypothetical protein